MASNSPKKKKIPQMSTDELRFELRSYRANDEKQQNLVKNLITEIDTLKQRLVTLEQQPPQPAAAEFNPREGMGERLLNIERRLSLNEQYSRRETVEIVGLPENLEGAKLEEKVVEMCNIAGAKVNLRSFHAIHRMKKQHVVIAKFLNRRDTITLLKNKKKLRSELSDEEKKKLGVVGDKKIYVNESLCNTYKRLMGQCNRLFKSKQIAGNYVFNGKIIIKKLNEESTIIQHEEDLVNLFGKDIIDNLFTTK